MPEGHTIHRAARDQERDLGGQRVRVSSPQGRFEMHALVDASGRALLRRVEACGKHLFYIFAQGRMVHVHLGLFGKFYRRKNPAPAPRASTRMRLEGESITIDLVGPTACALVTASQMRAITARLGPDPLREDVDPAPFYDRVRRSKTPIGALLLDQSAIAGIGNVYRAELLHLLHLHPETPASSLSAESVRELWHLASALLERGVEEKRIVTTRGPHLAKPRERVPRAESTYVYRQKTCLTCRADVIAYTLRARVVHYCRACQPMRDKATLP